LVNNNLLIKTSGSLSGILCLDDFEAAARRHLPHPVFEYVAGGVEDNVARDTNRKAFRDWEFVPRVLAGVKHRTTSTTIFGHDYSVPFGVAPIGIAALYAYRGDLVLARAAREANLPMVMSGSSLVRLEDVFAESPEAWFQAYLPGNPKQMMDLLERVKRAGYGTLVVTVDVPVSANRENNMRAGFSTPVKPTLRLAWDGITHPRWLFGTFLRTIAQHGLPHFENNYATRGAPILSSNVLRDLSDRGNLNWDDLARIREFWKDRRLIVKGILHAGDAKKACELGVDGVVVSNHGGRQLDGAVAPLRVLPEIVAACGEVPVMLDSGVRRGTDVIKALALGAKFVFLGRSFGYAAAVAGVEGVLHAFRILQAEIDRDMAMLGVNSIEDLVPDLLRRSCR
jgi:L-lactate dehydrogenase (cytochrome)